MPLLLTLLLPVPLVCQLLPVLQAALERLDLPSTQSYLNDLFRQYDTDRDGSVDFEEFQRYVKQREWALRRAFR